MIPTVELNIVHSTGWQACDEVISSGSIRKGIAFENCKSVGINLRRRDVGFAQLGKIAGAFRRIWNVVLGCIAGYITTPFVRRKEEILGLISVVKAGDPEWAAQGIAEIVEAKFIARLSRLVQEKVVCVELVVPEIFVDCAMKVARALLCDNVDDASRSAAEFGAVIAPEYFEFFECIQGWSYYILQRCCRYPYCFGRREAIMLELLWFPLMDTVVSLANTDAVTDRSIFRNDTRNQHDKLTEDSSIQR